MGRHLSNTLQNYIDRDERTQADLIKKLAEDAGIARSTMYDVLSGYVNCPPESRIEAFARTLGIPVATLMAARDRDCGNSLSMGDVFID